MALATGTVLINRYRIVKRVGQGGFGAVYRAWDLSLLQPVALKENSGGGTEAQRQFEREAQLLAGLRHANLPRVIDHFVLPGQGQYLVMDFVEGKSLSDLLVERGGPLDEAEVLPWIRQVADALEYLHTRTPPIIHRDIKPDNVIITQEGRAILVDFGISKVYEASKSTTIGARAVTPGYSPPEQYGRGRTDARSDVYALGATLYTLLTGQIPPDGPDLASGADTLIPPREANPAVSVATSAAIVAAMTPNISQRLANAAGFGQLLAGGPPAGRPPVVLPPTTPKASPTRSTPAAGDRQHVLVWGWLLGVVALVALAAWAGVTFGGRGSANQTPETTQVIGDVGETITPQAVVESTATPEPSATPAPTEPAEPSATNEPTATPELVATLTPIATPGSQAGGVRTVTRGGVQVEQVFVPAGSFLMGTDAGEDDERPAHEVTLDTFFIDRTEVTNAQFAAFVAETDYETTAEREGGGHTYENQVWNFKPGANWLSPLGPGSNLEGMDAHPVVLASWDDAEAFCTWSGGRLPTEAEWEYAARGPVAPIYPWGSTFNSANLNFCDRNCTLSWADQAAEDRYQFSAPVISYVNGASWVGAMDMAGNVWEWVNDNYDADYYASSPVLSPSGPRGGTHRIIRGGSWYNSANGVRATDRGHNEPDQRTDSIGFRCAASLSDSGITTPAAEIAVAPTSIGNILDPARISLVDPAGCDQPGNFRDTATIPFQWRYDTNLGPGEYMEVRIEPNPGTASQGKVTSSVNGLWRQAVSVANFDVGAGSYQWVVVHMAADGRTELATSHHGCFTIWSDG